MSTRGKKLNVALRGHQAALRRLGFEQTYVDHHSGMQIYECAFPADEVLVSVQLWRNGRHSVSYRHKNLFADHSSPYGHATTAPITFGTVENMELAVEKSRTDWLKREKQVEERTVAEWKRDGEVRREHWRDVIFGSGTRTGRLP